MITLILNMMIFILILSMIILEEWAQPLGDLNEHKQWLWDFRPSI